MNRNKKVKLLDVVIFCVALIAFVTACLSFVDTVEAATENEIEYKRHLILAQGAAENLNSTLTDIQEYLLHDIIDEMFKAQKAKAKEKYFDGMQDTIEELVRQKMLTKKEVQEFAGRAADHYQEVLDAK